MVSSDVPAYEWLIFGGDDESRRIGNDLRRYLHHVHVQALRDAEGDLASWRRSPLRPLLEEVARNVNVTDLDAVASALGAVNTAIGDLDEVQAAAKDIEEQSQALVGELYRLQPTLDLAPTDPVRSLRALRLFLDGPAQRSLSTGSLGSLNVLYLALLQLELARLLDKGEIEHALISIEEPEVHLHPHLQRRMFAGLLAANGDKRSIMVTTHSPHIVSVVPPKQLIVLREVDGATQAFSALHAELSGPQWDDLGRYLDTTRAEMVFARRVLLVEGFAEQLLIPRLAAPALDLDASGVTVCAIHGVHFSSYIKFLRALGTPYAVITDGDPDAGVGRTGLERVRMLARSVGADEDDPAAAGLFYGTRTLESDIFEASLSNSEAMVNALLTLLTVESKRTDLRTAHAAGTMTGQAFLDHVKRQKGRFAQRLAAQTSDLDPPTYVQSALTHLMT